MLKVKDIMVTNVRTVSDTTPLDAVAAIMKEAGIGDVIVASAKEYGILTDRDIVVRALASNKDYHRCTAGEVCTHKLATIPVGASLDEAVKLFRDNAVRRLPVVEGNSIVGLVTMGDLALARDEKSALASVVAAPDNN